MAHLTRIMSKKAILLVTLLDGERFMEEIESGTHFSNPTVSRNLAELERDGLVSMVKNPDHPLRLYYKLTEKGIKIARPLEEVRKILEESG